MGIEYALVHAATKECFELGRGPWSEITRRTPRGYRAVPETMTRAEWTTLITEWLQDWPQTSDPTIDHAERMIARIWAFVETHPGELLIVNDCSGDHLWVTDRNHPAWQEVGEGKTWDAVYLQVGSRYDGWD